MSSYHRECLQCYTLRMHEGAHQRGKKIEVEQTSEDQDALRKRLEVAYTLRSAGLEDEACKIFRDIEKLSASFPVDDEILNEALDALEHPPTKH